MPLLRYALERLVLASAGVLDLLEPLHQRILVLIEVVLDVCIFASLGGVLVGGGIVFVLVDIPERALPIDDDLVAIVVMMVQQSVA